jgi:hypothetical protein
MLYQDRLAAVQRRVVGQEMHRSSHVLHTCGIGLPVPGVEVHAAATFTLKLEFARTADERKGGDMRGLCKKSHKPYFAGPADATHQRAGKERPTVREEASEKERAVLNGVRSLACRQNARYEVGAEALIQAQSG